MFDLFHVLLYLHVLGTIVAFGPTFGFPIMGGLSAREPLHGNFALRVALAIQDRLVLPLAASLAVTGVGLILTADPPVSITEAWLLASIALYACSLVLSLGVMRPTVIRLVALTSRPAPAPGGVPPAGVTAGGPPPGPPPEVLALLGRQRVTGLALTGLILVIVLLMVIQPGGAGA